MSKIQKWVTEYWMFSASVIFSVAALIAFLWFRIASTPSSFSNQEYIVHNNLANKVYTFNYFWNHIIYLPYYLLLSIPQLFDRYGLFSIRSIGAFFGLICVIVFAYITWRWWGTLIAVLATFLFTTSFWFLQVSRNSGPTILYVLAALVIILLGFVVRNKKRHETKTLLSALLALVLLYIPGMIWFVLAACILQRKLIIEEFKKLPTQVKFIIPLAGIILLIPLIHVSYNSINEIKTTLGLPQVFSLHNFLVNLIHWPLIIFIRSPHMNIFSLGHLPILSVFVDVMFILGLYWIWLKRKLDRFYLLGATIILSWVLYALGGPVSIYLSIPFIMCIAATGMAFILGQWFTIFPRNPVARSIGIIILIISVSVVCWFHVDEYFVAWPHASSTIATYSAHRI